MPDPIRVSIGSQTHDDVRQIPGFDGRYFATRDGRILSSRRRVTDCRSDMPAMRELKKFPSHRGYQIVYLSGEGSKTVARFVHRLVLEAFVGPRPEAMECRHLNADKTDNRLGNLCWDTQKANVADNIRLDAYLKGENNKSAKLTEADIRQMRAMRESGSTYREISQRFSVRESHVYQIVKRKAWKHVG